MLVAYTDESYDTRDCVGYWMATVIFHEAALFQCWTDLLEVGHRFGVPRATELHGTDLFGGTGEFANIGRDERIALYRRGLETIRAHAARVIVAAHVPGSSEVPAVHDWRMSVLKVLVPEIERVAREENEFVVIVCDEEQSTTTRVVQHLHDAKVDTGVLGTPILETAMFARSKYSPGVWPADLVAFLERRLELGYNDDARRRGTLRRLQGVYLGKRDTPNILTGTVGH